MRKVKEKQILSILFKYVGGFILQHLITFLGGYIVNFDALVLAYIA